ncbi:hypothetical protein QOZ80_1AG0039260 [Eleusine coracana subsp. coracana]|nr:hypothetical protein QOZ80_1AG0039260 [Eleusine coracana subsp. coracana]
MGSCPSLKNILVLDSEGKRVAVKYYSDEWPSLSSKLDFEKAVFMKIRKTGPKKEEEESVLEGFSEAVACVLPSKKLNKKTALENLDLIFLCLDEVTDEGIVLETDAKVIAEKVLGHVEGDEQTLSGLLTTARDHITRSLLN